MILLAEMAIGFALAYQPAIIPETKSTPEAWPPKLRESVSGSGWKIRFGNREHAWFFPVRKTQIQAEKEQIKNGLLPDSLKVGTLIGCMILDHQSCDFRGQSIPPGSFSLHYGLQPVSDDHADTAPSRHFAVYVPIEINAFEAKPDQDKLFRASGAITGKHPVVVPLLPWKPERGPRITHPDGDVWALGFSIPAESQEGTTTLPLQLVISGKSPAAK